MHVKITLILNVVFVRNISMYVCLNKLAFNRLLILDTEPKTFSTLWRTFIFSPVIVEKNRVIWSNSLFLIITAAKYFVETSWMSTWWKLTLTQLTLGVSLEDSIEHYALYHSWKLFSYTGQLQFPKTVLFYLNYLKAFMVNVWLNKGNVNATVILAIALTHLLLMLNPLKTSENLKVFWRF